MIASHLVVIIKIKVSKVVLFLKFLKVASLDSFFYDSIDL